LWYIVVAIKFKIPIVDRIRSDIDLFMLHYRKGEPGSK